jgi:hypothetical protein
MGKHHEVLDEMRWSGRRSPDAPLKARGLVLLVNAHAARGDAQGDHERRAARSTSSSVRLEADQSRAGNRPLK